MRRGVPSSKLEATWKPQYDKCEEGLWTVNALQGALTDFRVWLAKQEKRNLNNRDIYHKMADMGLGLCWRRCRHRDGIVSEPRTDQDSQFHELSS